MQILPIASGKGGVGKSVIAANLAIALSQAGKKVYLVDLDLGGSNLHLILGQRSPHTGLGTFLSSSGVDFQDCIVQTDYKNLFFIPGDAEIPGLANLLASQKQRIIRGLLALDGQYVIMDLGAGTGLNTIDFFLTSGRGIIASTPTPTATVNAYLFIKNAIFRIINGVFKKGSQAHARLETLRRDGFSLQKIYIQKFIDELRGVDPASHAAYTKAVERFHPRLILNMIDDPSDTEKAIRIRHSCRQYLGLDMEHLGVIYRDELQDRALQSRLPIIAYKPTCVLSQAIYRIADKLIQSDYSGDAPIDLRSFDDSYLTAEMEAGVDFDTKMEYVEELLHCGALTTGDLLETVKTQQLEINQMKKENQFLKSKLVRTMTEKR